MLVREEIYNIVHSSSCTCNNDIAVCRIVGGCSFYISARRMNECYCSRSYLYDCAAIVRRTNVVHTVYHMNSILFNN